MNDTTQEIPYGYCKCGCGQKTKISPQSSTFHGHTIGEPRDYLRGHNGRRHASVSLADAFWEHCPKGSPDICWLWQGHINVNGYGVLGFRGKHYYAHRVSYELHIGPIPSDKEVCHNCPYGDNPACCNPAHFFEGTQTDNMRDMHKKGRQARGENKANAIITEEIVRQIRELRLQGLLQREIAARFSIDRRHVGSVLNGKSWKHIT